MYFLDLKQRSVAYIPTPKGGGFTPPLDKQAAKVSAELMSAIIKVNGCGKSMQDIDEVSKLYLRLESNIAEVLLSLQRAVSCRWRLFILLPPQLQALVEHFSEEPQQTDF